MDVLETNNRNGGKLKYSRNGRFLLTTAIFAVSGMVTLYAQQKDATPDMSGKAPQANILSANKDSVCSNQQRKAFTRTYEINFIVDKSNIDTTFKDNGMTLRRMKHEIDSIINNTDFKADSIIIKSTASPEGHSAYNLALSRRRGESIASYISKLWPEIESGTFACTFSGEDWNTFWEIVEKDEKIPFREQIKAIDDSSLNPEEKEVRLREYRNGFFYILRTHAYQMRASKVTFNYSAEIPSVPVLAKGSVISQKAATSPLGIATRQTEAPVMQKKMILAARTNLLVPALNVGIEIPIKTKWSVGIDYYFPWWLAKNNQYCGEMLGLFIDGKYWFGKNRMEEDKLTGHALGLYVGAGYYDYQKKYSGYQGEYTDVGIDYTYAIPVGKKKRLRMEFNIGLGWIHTVARHYTPTDDFGELIKDPGIKHRKYNFFGPTRASVSFIVPIRINTRQKGGMR